MLVVDSSVAVCWSMPDESSRVADAALEIARRGFVVPALFFYEVRNTLIVNERRGRINSNWTEQALAKVSALAIVVDFEPDDSALMSLARQHTLSVYDASYLELAVRLGATVATLDRKLASAAASEGVAVIA
jgi:predicted nucleic acid-binding protein